MSKVFTIADGLQNLGALRTGGQGSVYKGMRMGPIYSAIKLIPTPIYVEDDSDKNYQNFLNEVTKLQKVNEKPSPNVVKILSSGVTESGSFPYIEMEYIDGPELSELLLPPNQKVFGIKELLKVTEQLASALAHCHSVGVKHGDLKSNNVKYNVHTANYVLLDFGLAIMSDEQRRTSIRHAGAIEFMAPEQHEGKMLMQTDVYSFGIILYELLAGQVPFPLDSNGETGRNSVMLGHLEKEVPNALQLRKENLKGTVSDDVLKEEMQVPHWLLNVIDRCVQKKPEDRYANGMELYKAVTNGLVMIGPKDFESHYTLSSEPLQQVGSKEVDDKYLALQNELASLKAMASKAGITFDAASATYSDKKYIHAPKGLLIGLSLAFMLIFAFLLYDKPVKTPQQTNLNAVASPPYEPPFVTYSKQYHERVMKAKQDSIRMAALRQAERKP